MMSRLRAPLALSVCMLGCTIISWLRLLQVHTLRVDDLQLPFWERMWPSTAFGFFAAILAWQYLSLLRTSPSLRNLAAAAIVLHLAAAPALPLTSNDIFSNLAYGHLD